MNNNSKYNTPETITERVADYALHHGDKLAFRFLNDGETENATLTYSELVRNARSIATNLTVHCKRGDRVVLLLHSSQAFIESFWACLFAGVVAVPAYPPRKNHNLERLKVLLSDCQPRVILSDRIVAENEQNGLLLQLSKAASWLIYEEIHYTAAAESNPPPDNITNSAGDADQSRTKGRKRNGLLSGDNVGPDDLAFLQYTSGSTGSPKGVMVSHGNIVANVKMMEQAFHMDSSSVCVSWLPLFHDLGLIGCMLLPIYLGSTVVLMPPAAFLQQPIRWLRALSKYRAKVTAAPNFAYELLTNTISATQRATLDLSSIELLACGAEPIRAETVNKFMKAFAGTGLNPAAFYPAYGMAETTLFTCGGAWNKPPPQKVVDAQSLSENLVSSNAQGRTQTLVANGHPWGDADVIICDPVTGEELANGAVGEIWISGSHIAQGYWNNPELSGATFNNYVSSSDKGPYLRSGDLGCIIDNELYITGRAKDLIVIRGKNHYPQDIEFSVSSCAEQLQEDACAAFSIATDTGEALVILQEVKRSARRTFNGEEMTQRIREVLAKEHEVPLHSLVFLNPNRLFKTSSGKIQRSACKQAYLAQQLPGILYEWHDNRQTTPVESLYPLPSNASKDLETCRRWLRVWIANRINASDTDIDLEQSVTSYGLDSMDSFALLGDFSAWLEIHINPDTIWGVDTVDELAIKVIALLDTNDFNQDDSHEVSGTL